MVWIRNTVTKSIGSTYSCMAKKITIRHWGLLSALSYIHKWPRVTRLFYLIKLFYWRDPDSPLRPVNQGFPMMVGLDRVPIRLASSHGMPLVSPFCAFCNTVFCCCIYGYVEDSIKCLRLFIGLSYLLYCSWLSRNLLLFKRCTRP